MGLIKVATPADFPMEDFLNTPFTHHSTILRKCENNEERYYYMHRCVEEHMAVERLKVIIGNGDFKKGIVPNNFLDRIGDKSLARKAVMQFKDSQPRAQCVGCG